MAKVNPIPSADFDLATRGGRRRAERDLVWSDHGFLRSAFSNFHWIEPGKMARANQPAPSDIDRYARMGIKTILNLRGKADTGYYVLEKEACERNGMVLVDQRMHSRQPPSREQVRQAKHLFESIEYPALMHCKSGADRAGAMAVLYAHLVMGQPIALAMQQLSFKYLHVRQGKTGMIDFFFQTYLDETERTGKPFLQWVEEDYVMEKVVASFHSQWWANLLVDRILRRE
ncbi:MAG: tyrosine-protein phosphatase [Proteobacteria bacterium]|nr:tyrosine-protein phosphatase [Pseudomonadota bacterium]